MDGREFLGCSQDVFHRNAASSAADAFCTRDNWQGAVLFLTQELSNLGLPSPCANDDATGQGSLDIVGLVNIAFQLVQSYKRCLKTISDLEAQIQRSKCDLDQSRLNTSRQREVIEAKKRQTHEHAERERQANEKLDQERERLKQAKDEVRRLNSALNHRDTLWTYDLKRRDAEISKLKARLVKVLADKAERAHMSVQIHYPAADLHAADARAPVKTARWTEAKERWADKLQKDVDYLNTELQGLQECLFADLADVISMPLSFSHSNIAALAKGLVENVEELVTEKSQAMKLQTDIAQYEKRITQQEKSASQADVALVSELQSMFNEGKELLRVNHRILEKEKAGLRQKRAEIDQREAELETMKKELLLQYDGNDLDDLLDWGASDPGPNWSRKESTPKAASRALIPTGRSHGTSRPPSRSGGGSKPGSRSQSAARKEKGASPFQAQGPPPGGAIRRGFESRRMTPISRPRSANISPQRVTSPFGRESPCDIQTLNLSGSAFGRKASKWRTGSVSPAATLQRPNSRPKRELSKQLSLNPPPKRPLKSGPDSALSDSELRPASPAPVKSDEECAPRQGQMDELAAQLDKLGNYIQRREQNPDASESEMEEHLQAIREALIKRQREEAQEEADNDG